MDYETALVFIQGFLKHGVKLGLERISEILERLGHPERQFRSIHVAGTNGKGSTTAMLDSVLREIPLKTGRYTSPHLSSYRERFTINGAMIAREQLAELVSEIKPVIKSVIRDGFGDPTEFEVGTAIAFLFFAREQVEIAIVEVGLGGRFDATNVIQPVLSVISHIALDHQAFLGDTLEKIAFEKAGIIKRGVPVVVGLQERAIEKYLSQIGASREAPVKLSSEITTGPVRLSDTGTECRLGNTYFGEINLRLNLLGKHQLFNSLNVVDAVEILAKSGIQISRENLRAGLAKTVWPGRMELVSNQTSLKLYLDGAHNPDGARALVETIKTIYPGEKVDLLVGILNNRPLSEMAEIFTEIAGRVIVTEVPDPKSARPGELAEIFKGLGIDAIAEPLPEKALGILFTSNHSVAVASGSLYLIGLLRSLIFKIGD
jgi:dihydrofolate synthase / folylpolyglutamate synthase